MEAQRSLTSREATRYGGNSDTDGIAEFAGLENDGVEQEQTYILHTTK